MLFQFYVVHMNLNIQYFEGGENTDPGNGIHTLQHKILNIQYLEGGETTDPGNGIHTL